MKQFLLSICFAFSVLGAINAQDITVSPNPVEAIFNSVPLNGDDDLVPEHVAITNNTADTIRLKWLRETTNCHGEWRSQICDNSFCFVAAASTNFNPPQVDVPFMLKPGETFHDFLLHVLPGTIAGCCEYKIHFSTIENPDVVLETLIFDVRVNDPECAISSTKEPAERESLQVFPNPSTGQFSITDYPLVKSVAVFNLLGKAVCVNDHQNGKLHDIGSAPDGLYLVNLLDENGQVLKTLRMTKQGLRP